MQVFFLLLAVLVGALLPIQAGLNAELGGSLRNPFYATLLSFVVGIAGLILYGVVTRFDWKSVDAALQLPWYYWLGGLLGAVYVAALIVLTPRLGAALTFGLTIAGQLVVSLVLDHYGWLGMAETPISPMRIVGVVLVIAGVVLVRLY